MSSELELPEYTEEGCIDGEVCMDTAEQYADVSQSIPEMRRTTEPQPLVYSTFSQYSKQLVDRTNVVSWPSMSEHYLPVYPHPFDVNFQKQLSEKREFAMLHSTLGETIRDGDLYAHQKFVRLFLSQYDRLFLVSEPGTGKTCSVVAFCEYVVRLKKFNITNPLTRIKRFVIVVKSSFHAENIKNMIGSVCSGGFYLPSDSGYRVPSAKRRCYKAMDADKRRRIIHKRMAHAGYEFVTYRGLSKQIMQNYTSTDKPNMQAMRSRFKDTLVWVDEAHNVAISPSELSHSKATVKHDTYWALHTLFHEAEGLKIVLSTATPMLNDAGEIVSLVNLLRPEDGKPPRDWDWMRTDDETFKFRFPGISRSPKLDVSTAAKEFVGGMNPAVLLTTMETADLAIHFRGLFAYSRQDPVGVSVEYQGSVGKVNMDDCASVRSLLDERGVGNLILYQTQMSKFQSKYFEEIYEGLNDTNYFFQVSRKASNFVFPDGSVREGFDRYMTVSSTGVSKPTTEFSTYLSKSDNIKRSSCKFNAIIEQCNQSPGNCFVYGEHVQGSGIYVLAACLEAQGYIRYTDSSAAIDCATDQVKEPLRNTDVKRFVLFTGDTQDQFSNIMELMNSKHNMQGKYIKIFISSKIGREGITVKNVRQIHLVSSEWTSSGLFQATSRGIRAKAHADLKSILGENEDIVVKVFLHCSVSRRNHSMDRNMYFTAERKDCTIQKVMNVIKRCAVNCQIDYDKNVWPLDDRVGKAYAPWDAWGELGADESSYAPFMYKIVASVIKDRIYSTIHSKHYTSNASALGEVVKCFSKMYDAQTLGYAIQWHLKHKVHCMDIYARPGRVELKDGLMYYTTCKGVNSPNYSDVVVGLQNLNLDMLVSNCENRLYTNGVTYLRPDLMTVHSFARLLNSDSLSTVGLIYLIEEVLKQHISTKRMIKVDLWADINAAVEDVRNLDRLGISGREIAESITAGFNLMEYIKDADPSLYAPLSDSIGSADRGHSM